MSNWHTILNADHRDAEQALEAIGTLLLAGSWEQAATRFDALQRDLDRHFALEEQALFPVLNQYRSMMLMDVEHDELNGLRDTFSAELRVTLADKAASSQLLASFQAFREQLIGHILEEDTGVFPLALQVLEPEEDMKADRLFAECIARFETGYPGLVRHEPHFSIRRAELFEPPPPVRNGKGKPIVYQTLYQREHTQLQHMWLKAGQALARHWAAQHQCLVLISGEVEFQADGESQLLEPGGVLIIDSRLPFSIRAIADAHLLAFKHWPHPHYTKA